MVTLSKEQIWNALQVDQVSCENCSRPGFYGEKYCRVWYKTRPRASHEYPYRYDPGSPFCKLCKQDDGFTKWKYDGIK